jgi:hypothetical protein
MRLLAFPHSRIMRRWRAVSLSRQIKRRGRLGSVMVLAGRLFVQRGHIAWALLEPRGLPCSL